MQLMTDSGSLFDGPYKVDWPTGERRVRGQIRNGLKQDEWSWWCREGTQRRTAMYDGGRLHGPVSRWYPSGRIREQLSYQRGNRHGPWAAWHANGRTSIDGEFNQGRPHRVLLCFWDSGRARIAGNFWLGVPVGEWRAWTENGALVHRGLFEPEVFMDLLPDDIASEMSFRSSQSRVA